MDDSSLVLVSDASDGSRKRKRTMSKRERAKKYMNHMPNAEDFEVKCKHLKTALECHGVSTEDVKRVREFVYRQPIKTIIDDKIAHLIEVKKEKRRDNDTKYQNYLKRGAKLENYQPKQIELRNSIKKIKLENVKTLLKKYQEDWEDNETFAWYKNLLNERRHPTGDEEETCPESDDVDPELCDCAEEDIGLKI
ncbi:unnamed protein product [Acanthoscelides obtectus]|uniref:Uncharacterized protein n=1 Tax=Acanthoscelides obtectus TaxID=200917 RepID=A0A9P0JRA5_ACAOB|nr:unnamed protein product [Acanthoscelides obtectus]CAK1671171.1 hypothetical protein AOBTE_LOCUS28109 [Acanthoscelides obtectus]